jgi:hypothetical protein
MHDPRPRRRARTRARRALLTALGDRGALAELKTHQRGPRVALRAKQPDGVYQGACRHLVKDRMDITGARWRLDGAEAILKLRAIRTNGDFDEYWTYHLERERQRIHETRYANGVIPHEA